MLGILGPDDLLDLQLDRLGGQVITIAARDARVEKILELEDALWGVDVLVGGHARHRRFVHADVVGDVAQDERPQVGRALLEELALEPQDRLGHAHDGALALLDRADEPLGAA
jgi:hypothetical protein